MNKSSITETSDSCPLLHQLLQSYEAEFSPLTGKQPGPDGNYMLDVDLTLTENHLYLLEDTPIGFCIKGETDGHHDILEFYIQPELRSNGRGEQLAHEIFSKHKGPWQVRQIEGAHKARNFWRRAIHNYTGGLYSEAQLHDPYWGPVTRQRFTSL
ncbi:hypothetical protein Rhal01_03304 [Rubritalea halochordaticola]|uniref:GNAT family N-acetyltransferase n=1 Tax=Rubritalea halochordaticola TaxID=714537 RepID=A0ABP9V375_9BACT